MDHVGGRRRSVIAAVAVAVTASTDQGGSSMSYAIIHQFNGFEIATETRT
jgi:hypothetical protein